jgi:dolichyl-diphosphooligosaccharide--protein glycosyltransferase
MEIEARESGSDRILEERKRKFKEFFSKRPQIFYIVLLLLVVWLGAIYIRTAPIPYLKDVTTGNWTLGPDLDPFLFLRLAETIVEKGSLPAVDVMRYVPLGFNNIGETKLLPYTIAYLYKFLHFFDPNATVTYAAIIHPVICFAISLIFFFLMIRKIFANQGKHQSNIIALIATAFLAVIPAFLHRTLGGITEKEPLGMAMMFAAFYFFISAMQAKNPKTSLVHGSLAGLSTALMGLVWGGIIYVFVIVGLAGFISFILGKIHKKEFLGYTAWIAVFTLILGVFTTKYGGLAGLFLSTTSGFSYFVFLIMLFDIILFKTKIKDRIKTKLPHQLVSFCILIVIILAGILLLKPGMISHTISDIKTNLINPITASRLLATVAENNQPYFDTWKGNFGIGFFWIFLIGSMLLFYECVKNLKSKWSLSLTYIVMIMCIIFSRYSPNSVMNGVSGLSQFVYIGSLFLFGGMFIFCYLKEYKKEGGFDVDISLILALTFFFFSALLARGGIRLFHVLVPAISMTAAFLNVKLVDYFIKSKGETLKYTFGIGAIIIIILSGYYFYTFENQIYNEALYSRPSSYNVQWQQAMSWVRENTPQDAVFAHWWDYGYWVQSIGQRATVLDGGNMIPYWDHLMGRHVLTGQNETEALEFLKTHNATYLLIDPTDIGKYPAYSSIGGDENYDRYSWMSTFLLDERQTRETRNETTYVYTGGTILDKDIVWQNQIYPAERAAIGAFTLNIKREGEEWTITQPTAIIIYQGKQVSIPLKGVYFKEKLLDFGNGFGYLYITPRITSEGINEFGAALYISEKSINALWVKLYLLNQTEGNFELVHAEQNLIIQELRSKYNLSVSDIAFYGDTQGPIKIWKINYPENITIKPEYLLLDYPDHRLSEVRK